MRSKWIAVAGVGLLSLLGCDPPAGEPDSAIVLPDAGGSACAEPTDGFGTSEESNFLWDYTLQRCDGSEFDFYADTPTDGFCDTSFTLVVAAAGWCGPCRAEAEEMEARIVQAYAEHGVRVVTVIIQDNTGDPPDLAFCQGWVDQYGATNPVMIDTPAQRTQIYFPAGSLPSNLIVDSTGKIVYRTYGTDSVPGLPTLRAVLDDLLGL